MAVGTRLWLPDDQLHLIVSKSGYGEAQVRIKPGEPERTVTLEAGGWSIAGRVIDAETKAPLTEFRVVEGDNYSGHVIWRQSSVVKNANGQYHAHWDDSGNGHRVVRIEANGHLPSESRAIEGKPHEETFNVALQKGKEIAGRVLDRTASRQQTRKSALPVRHGCYRCETAVRPSIRIR